MTNDKFENILKEHGIYGENIEEILYAVSDMLNYEADKTKQDEPYVTNTIERLEKAALEVYDLANEL